MGVTIDNANALVKIFLEQGESMGRVLRQNALQISKIKSMHYNLSYLMASSSTGLNKVMLDE